MANSAKLTDGATEYEFVYDSATQDDYKLRYGMRVGGGEPRPLWHRPDNGQQKLVRLNNDNQTIFLTTIVYGTDRNDVLNNLTKIKRWVDGDDQQAARYHTDGDVDKIVCRIQLDGATNYTDWTVVYGNVDDSGAFYEVVADRNTIALDVVVMLVCEPLGEGQSYTPDNLLPNSDMRIESTTSGLAAGLSVVGTPTVSLSTSNWLYAGQAQRILTDSSTSEGFDTDLQTISIGTDIVAFVYILASSTGNDPITIRLQDGSGNVIQDATYNPSNASGYDRSATSFPNSNRFRRYVVSGANSSAANARIRVFRAAANATQNTEFWVDCIYMQTGTTTAPPFWCSHRDLDNRFDAGSTSTRRINTLDFFGIPGDSEALLTLAYTPTPASKQIFIMGRGVDGIYSAGEQAPWVEAQGGTGWTTSNTTTNGAWTTPADAGYSNSDALRFTASGGTGEGTHTAISSLTSTRKLTSGTKRVFLIAETGSISTVPGFTVEIKAGVGTGSKTTILTAVSHNVETANQHLLFDCGILDTTQIMNQYATTLTLNTTFNFIISVFNVANTNWIQFDGFFIIPTEEFGVQNPINAVPAAGTFYLDGRTRQFFLKSSGVSEPTRGGIFRLAPGRGNRLAFVQTASDFQVSISESFDVVPTVTPRTRHLLGTS